MAPRGIGRERSTSRSIGASIRSFDIWIEFDMKMHPRNEIALAWSRTEASGPWSAAANRLPIKCGK